MEYTQWTKRWSWRRGLCRPLLDYSRKSVSPKVWNWLPYSPSQKCSRRSQVTVARFPRVHKNSSHQDAMTANTSIYRMLPLCTRLRDTGKVRLKWPTAYKWCWVAEPQFSLGWVLNPRSYTPESSWMKHICFFISYVIRPCPPALESLSHRPRTEPATDQYSLKEWACPCFPLQTLFPQPEVTLLLSHQENLSFKIWLKRYLALTNPTPISISQEKNQFHKKKQL